PRGQSAPRLMVGTRIYPAWVRPVSAKCGVVMRMVRFGAALAVWVFVSTAWAGPFHFGDQLQRLQGRIQGQIVDYTHNHGSDRRIWSAALCQKRDLYIYLPPCYDPARQYPFMLWLHGYAQDEQAFLEYVAEPLDRAIVCGKLPPLIVAVPDGSISGTSSYMSPGSFFINTKAGRFEDFLMQDVWNFVMEN